MKLYMILTFSYGPVVPNLRLNPFNRPQDKLVVRFKSYLKPAENFVFADL